MVTLVRKLGNEFAVNTTVSGYQSRPNAAQLAGGNVIVIWTDQTNTTPGFDLTIKGQLYTSTGVRIGGEFVVNVEQEGPQTDAVVTALADGNFAVAWTSQPGFFSPASDGSGTAVRAIIMDSSGHVVVPEFQVNTNGAGDQTSPQIAALPNSSFVVTWQNSGSPGAAGIRAQVFAADGSKVAGEITVSAEGAESQAVGLGGGRFAIVWRSLVGPTDFDIKGQVYDAATGAPIGGGFTVNATLAGSQFFADVTPLGDGGFVAAWISSDAGANSVRAQRFDADGAKVGPEVLAGTPGHGGHEPSVTAVAAGYLVSWTDVAGPNYSVRGQLFDLAGQRLGDEFQVNTKPVQPGGDYVDVTTLASGDVFAVWENQTDTAAVPGIEGQIFDMPEVGTAGADIYGGTAGPDTYLGLGGDDQLSGGDSDDTLLGGDGNDQVAGGEGDDILVGGDGNDSLDGAGGNDLLLGGAGVDTYAGGAGTDTADFSDETGGNPVFVNLSSNLFITPVGNAGGFRSVGPGEALDSYGNYESLSGIENVRTGGGNDHVQGNSEANRIETGAGNDLLSGGAGADTLVGGSGNDRYFILTADGATFEDTIVELTGGGTDEVFTDFGSFALPDGEIEKLTGTGASQTLIGNSVDNIVTGGSGNDILVGGFGNDILDGGSGGTDTVDYSRDVATNHVSVNLSDQAVGDRFGRFVQAHTGRDGFAFSGVDTLIGIENVVTGDSSDDVYGDGGANRIETGGGGDLLFGGGGNDTLLAGSGDDLLFGGAGNDVLDGGDGIDTATYADASAGVTVFLGSSAPQDTGGGGVDTLQNLENLTGSAFADLLTGDSGNNVLNGGAGNDVLDLSLGGNDNALGSGGNDYLYFGGAFTAADKADGGTGTGTDTVALLGTYNLTLAATSFTGVETLSLLSGTAAGGTGHVTYSITTVDSNVPAGGTLTVYAGGLLPDETLLFDGHAETDGKLSVFGGAANDIIAGGPGSDAFVGGGGDDQLYGLGGNDWLEGGAGADSLRGGLGSDLFVYKSASESTATATDHILDFESSSDLINLQAIDADTNTGGDQAFSFIGQNAFSHTAGELRISGSGSTWFVEGDVNGDGVADLVIQVDTFRGNPLQASDFMP
jgi:Ca2+-binding RTX toxin-like protein